MGVVITKELRLKSFSITSQGDRNLFESPCGVIETTVRVKKHTTQPSSTKFCEGKYDARLEEMLEIGELAMVQPEVLLCEIKTPTTECYL